ncbi:MAG: glycosyltransferase [Patescibacteria group bacterium]|nr:glycosyltransferase [Patescibacteria group bacterium]
MITKEEPSWILYVGTFPPRECGIATFTHDLANAIANKMPSLKTKVLALNRGAINIYNYQKKVIFEINESNIQEYIDIAKKINSLKEVKLVCIQHEFGIFGGEWGSYLVPFLETLQKPIVVTLHSLLPHPDDHLKNIVQSIARYARCLIVMTPRAIKILRNDYNIKSAIEIIPHGIPSVPFVPNLKPKIKLGYQDRIVLSSFGLVSEDKGYEYVIAALPKVVEKFPNLLYLIIGETHPVVRSLKGEEYRNSLEKNVQKLKLQHNVKFYNKYLTLQEIIQYLQATDVYVASNLNPYQITSGTLAYALGCGRAVISTPFLHARDVIQNENQGILVDFKNPQSFAKAILKILNNPDLKTKIEKEAYSSSRMMTWPNVALSYTKIFQQYSSLEQKSLKKLPQVSLKHFKKLSDNFGIIQFAQHATPDPNSGYSTDDVARGLIALCYHYRLFRKKNVLPLLKIYLNFIQHVQKNDGRFFNFVNHNQEIDLKHWSEDAHGRAVWALGTITATKSLPQTIRNKAKALFQKAIPPTKKLKYSRAIACALIGICKFHKIAPSLQNIKYIQRKANSLVALYRKNSNPSWQWFERKVSYSNGKLPAALLYAYLATKKQNYLQVAEKTLDFLCSITFENEIFSPIGQRGWYTLSGKRAYFDQQPEEAAEMVQALTLCYKITKQKKYLNQAINAFYWFLGKNLLNRMVYDESTGGCHDGLRESSVNLNQGAESTISYLLARLTLKKYLNNKEQIWT